ncbi:MAG: hypothetical protein F6K47_30570 [Symploca sp. SIO2E6]|nr:hypothetical protein [Symploca sp. SIO2E6]
MITQLTQKKNFYPLQRLVTIVLVLILCAACSEAPLPIQQLPSFLPGIKEQADFAMSVKPSVNEGEYEIEGTTNLPDDSPIAVAAIRYLRPEQQSFVKVSPEATYSILDYQEAEVKDGKWQITLNLWKVALDGEFKEEWQLGESELGLELEPEPEVTFLATLDPTTQFSEIERQLDRQGIKLARSVIRTTPDGDSYVQASEVMTIDLPTGKTTPPVQTPDDLNGGWGPRYLLIPEPPIIYKLEKPKEHRTNEPFAPEEFL